MVTTQFYNIFLNSSSISIAVMEEFHDYTMMFLTIIMTFIFIIMFQMMKTKNSNYNFKENINLEIIWTILPMIILFLIAYPSLYYLYLFDLSMNPTISMKVIGAQWYWIYEYFDESGLSYSSYMLSDLDLLKSDNYKLSWRLLETDTRLVIPYGTEVQCITTSMDVIHSFSIPELGIKIDAIPGRLNSINFQVTRPGTFFGQCAEICGTGHSFMPICLEAV
uniref:cytochrome c oxidase subunit II n=1 Tax=Mycterothrips gongshanensis TaxID=2792509 RepID=UPI0022008F12|nr:cytochrome c oxidase subunit II [Mycterothrips gongshanensis]UXW64205.1 cytochrome c oxidase subunit II [Mycterothrips gongshanensis]